MKLPEKVNNCPFCGAETDTRLCAKCNALFYLIMKKPEAAGRILDLVDRMKKGACDGI